MINSYRKRFIFATMVSLFVLIGIMIGLTNIINYIKTCKDSDLTIQTIVNQEGPFNPFGGMPPMEGDFRERNFDREEVFRTRYFSITFDEDGNYVAGSVENINLTSEQALEIAKTIYDKNSSKGFYEQYRYNVIEKDNGTMVFMLDCAKERMANNDFLVTSLIISLSAYLVVFGLMVIVSKIVVRPFYENMEKQKRFITDASHELKTPLTIMSADVEVLEIENGENEWLDSIKKQIERLSGMTKKLTLMSKMEEDTAIYNLNDFDISSKLNESVEDFTTLLSTKDKKLLLDIEEGIHINGNEELIKELFFILLENAYKYSTSDVSILLKKENKNVRIEFSNGADVSDGPLDYLFDRFYRMDSSRNSKTGGNGVGLSIAKSIVEINHGQISATGENGVITFKIMFKA